MAYEEQYKGIERFLEILKQNGFYSVEGPCGTGKTLIAVTAGIEAMRNNDYPHYEQTCVLTPNKQQLNQFIEEMRGVNEALPNNVSPVKTVVMKGRRDMMPYAYCDLPPFDEKSVNTQADRLRKNARKVIKFNSDIPLNWPNGMSPPPSAHYDYNWEKASAKAKERREQNTYDPKRAEAVRKILINKQENDPDYEQLTVDGVATPYPDVVPHTQHIVDKDQLQDDDLKQLPPRLRGKFDPFYVGFFVEGYPNFGFPDVENHVFDRDGLFENATKAGICPHETMSHYGERAEVILGNYMHIFDPLTRNLTVSKMGLFNEKTITVFDEAHQIESRVRDMLSNSVSIYTLSKAINDLEYMRAIATNDYSQTPIPTDTPNKIETVTEAMDTALDDVEFMDVTEADLQRVEDLLRYLKQKINELAADHLQESYPRGWQREVEYNGASLEEIPLTNPEFPNTDGKLLRKITSQFNDGADRMKTAYGIFHAINNFFDLLADENIYEREPQPPEVGKLLHDWVTKNVEEYHRELRLEPSEKESIPTEYPTWVQEWTPEIQLYNCIPTEELKEMFSTIGAGIFMSATLSPPEVFQSVIGVNKVPPHPETNHQTPSSQEEKTTRPSRFDQYPLRFPEENRLSVIATLPKFTAGNRGQITTDHNQMTQTRKRYADAIKEICETHGNILICLPKYAEAKWAHEMITDEISKPCYLDQSSTNNETTEMLSNFFTDKNSVLFTSTRGTITEGVDYDGEKLHTVAVVGIPFVDTRPARVEAIQYAYSKTVPDKKGFETAIKIPAVRKSRQAIGRAIRGADEIGVRILVDERYKSTDWDGANQYLSEEEQEEFESVSPGALKDRINRFWTQAQRQDTGSPSTNQQTQTDTSQETTSDNHTTGKVYFGEGCDLNGWIEIKKRIIENKIAPVVEANMIDDDTKNSINFITSSNAPIDGWVQVTEEAVDEIKPIVEEHRSK